MEENLRVSLEQRKYFIGAALLIGVLAGLALVQMPEKGSQDREFNRNDLMFMNMIIVHHDQAIEMAEMAENRTNNSDILKLSNNISDAQREENQQMKQWMRSLGYEPGNHHRMAGMASQEEMQRIENSEGAEFDRIFAELMIEHHRGGIEMARNFRKAGKHTELQQMQTQMIETQQKEIEKMQDWQEQGL